MNNYAIIIGCVFVVAIGQLLFKYVGLRLGNQGFEAFLNDYKAAGIFLVAITLYAISTLGWVLALRQVPLSTAYLCMSLSFLIVPIGAWIFFNEPANIKTLLASVLIISGIYIASTA